MTFFDSICNLPEDAFTLNHISIRPIRSDEELWYATVQCQLAPGQSDFVNPSGFSIGRAWLQPEDHVPCLIYKEGQPIGFLLFRHWADDASNSWSYYLDKQHQGHGLGKAAAQLAVQILKSAHPDRPIKLSAEAGNEKAHRLYRGIGFSLSEELDGDDLVFIL